MKLFQKIFKFKCNHKYKYHRTNKLRLDCMGYPLRLFIGECTRCGNTKHLWIDVSVEQLEELKTGQSVLIE